MRLHCVPAFFDCLLPAAQVVASWHMILVVSFQLTGDPRSLNAHLPRLLLVPIQIRTLIPRARKSKRQIIVSLNVALTVHSPGNLCQTAGGLHVAFNNFLALVSGAASGLCHFLCLALLYQTAVQMMRQYVTPLS